jgi:hypothetical protein
MIEYLRTRAAEMSATAIRTRIATAARELEHTVAGVRSSEARLRPILGKWRTPK